jgi:hypothetical protein
MEELQDAIEDAQYMNAINDDTPKPTKDWRWPTPEELTEYTDKLQATSPKAFEAEGFCKHGCLGFYMVRNEATMQCPARGLIRPAAPVACPRKR